MKKDIKIMEVELPTPAAADLTTRAAKEGVSTAEYIGIQALAGAYGHLHPAVAAFNKRPKMGHFGTKTRRDECGGED